MLRCRKSFWILAFVIGGLVPALHADNGDQVHLARRIVVEQNEAAGNLVCIGCAIRVHGTSQDIVAIGGSIDIDGRSRATWSAWAEAYAWAKTQKFPETSTA